MQQRHAHFSFCSKWPAALHTCTAMVHLHDIAALHTRFSLLSLFLSLFLSFPSSLSSTYIGSMPLVSAKSSPKPSMSGATDSIADKLSSGSVISSAVPMLRAEALASSKPGPRSNWSKSSSSKVSCIVMAAAFAIDLPAGWSTVPGLHVRARGRGREGGREGEVCAEEEEWEG